MKSFKEQIRIPDYSWLFNQHEKRTFCVVGKIYKGHNTPSFRVESYEILEVGKNKSVKITYELMENLIETQSLIVL